MRIKMVKTDTLAGLEDGYNGLRMVERRNGYRTRPVRGEEEYLREFLIFSEPFVQAALLRERVVSCFFESPTVGLLEFRSD